MPPRLLIGEDAQARQLELEQCILASIQVGRHDVLGPVDQAVKHIAATCGQHEQRILWTQLEDMLVDARVLPRDVVCHGEGRWWGAARRGRRGGGSCAQMMQLFSMSSGIKLPGLVTFTSAPHMVCHS